MTMHLDFYELKKDPFDARPGRGPVLATRPLRDAIAWLTDRIEANDYLMCVTGVPGIGRSCVARVLPGRLASHCRIARLVDPRRPWQQQRVDIADQLSLDGALGRHSLLTARSQGDRVVIVVDAAERADGEFLEHLDRLIDLRGPARERLVQVVLFAREPDGLEDVGDVEAEEAPFWSWLDKRHGTTRQLDPISPSEIHGYIRRRVENAGLREGELFTETASLVVHRHTRGVPRRVNEVCHAVLQEAVRSRYAMVDGRLVADAVATGLV